MSQNWRMYSNKSAMLRKHVMCMHVGVYEKEMPCVCVHGRLLRGLFKGGEIHSIKGVASASVPMPFTWVLEIRLDKCKNWPGAK